MVPLRALKLMGEIMSAMGEGKPVSLVPVATKVTTQKAAELLGCSRLHLVKLYWKAESWHSPRSESTDVFSSKMF